MKIFLGYPSERKETVREIYKFLCSHNFDVWFDENLLIGADEWNRKRKIAQMEADFVIHIYSKELNMRTSVAIEEIRDSLDQARRQPLGKPYLLIIKLGDVSIPPELAFFQYLRYEDDNFQIKILEALNQAKNFIQLNKGETIHIEQNSKQDFDKELIVFSDINGKFSGQGKYFRYKNQDKNDIYWRFINSKLSSFVLEEFFDFKSSNIELINDTSSNIELIDGVSIDNHFRCELSMEEFHKCNEVLSIKITGFFDTGGAHPNYWIQTLNFMGRELGLVDIKELLDYDNDNAMKILEYCEKVINAGFADESPDFEAYKHNYDDIWSLISQFSIDNKGVTINFSPYDVLPFAFGSHEVIIPWSLVESIIPERFIKAIEGN